MKKKRIIKGVIGILFLGATVLFSLISFAPKSIDAQQDSLLVDPEFNNVPADYNAANDQSAGFWTKYMTSTFVTDNTLTDGGAIKLTYDSADGSISTGLFPAVWQDVTLEKYTYYTFSVYVKRIGNADNGYICIGYRNPNASNHFTSIDLEAYNDTTSSFSQISITFCTYELTDIRLAVHVETKSTGKDGAYIVDSASLTKLANKQVDSSKLNSVFATGTNLLNDSGFEENQTSICANARDIVRIWTSASWCGIDKLNYGYRSLSNAYLIYSHTDLAAGEVPACYQDVDVEKNTYYVLTFMARRFGDGEISPLYAGYRDPLSTDPWLDVERVKISDVSGEYEKRSVLLYSGNRTTIRITIATDSIKDDSGQLGGYHIDNVSLTKAKEVDDVKITYDTDFVIGERINQTYEVKFVGEDTYNRITLCNHINLDYEVDDQIIKSDNSGNLVAVGTGTANIKATFTVCCKKIVKENEITVTEENENENLYVKNVYASLESDISTMAYSKIDISVKMSNGVYLSESDYDLTVKSGDTDVVYVRTMTDGYYAIGVGNGTASIYVTVIVGDSYGIAKIDNEIDEDNYLVDSSFEAQKETFVWMLEGSSGGATDDGKTNIYMRTGYANLWLMSPVWWDSNVKNDSYVRVSQAVDLPAGKFELSVYINRFAATGVDGTLSGKGGTVTLGIVKLDDEGNETDVKYSQDFDTSYGSIAYEKLSLVFTVEEGTYLAYLYVKGDNQFGLGMQVDDMQLKEAVYPTNISVSVDSDVIYVDDISKINVIANYEDGTSEALSGNIRYIFGDYSVACESNGFLIGRKVGETTLTIKTTILDRTYETTMTVVITGTNPGDEPDNNKYLVYWMAGSSVLSLGLATGAFFIVRRKRRLK